ncbi:MAG: hypothetical protein ACFFC1_13325 [Promethearchaeota archaeon]
MFEKLTSIFNRIFFGVALIFFGISVLEWIVRLFGSDVRWFGYDPGRLFEFSGIFLLFAITLLLRQIRELLKK